jgi:hypothetical protein
MVEWFSSPILADTVTVPELHIIFNTVSIIPVNTTKRTGNKAVILNNRYIDKRKLKKQQAMGQQQSTVSRKFTLAQTMPSN